MIEPSVAQKSAASRSHNYLLDLLNTGQFGNRIADAYLSGSYARDTAISPIDDVDVIVVVDPNGWRQSMWSGNPAPDRILQSFATTIRYRYAVSSVHVQRRSVCLELNHLDIDVVPAIAVSGGPHRVMIPDASSGEWIVSAPKVHTILATDINKTHGGRFKPLVKLLKHWNSLLPETARLKSFAIETMAATLFHKVDLPDLQEGLRRFFDFAASFADSAVIYRWPDRYGMSLGWGRRKFRISPERVAIYSQAPITAVARSSSQPQSGVGTLCFERTMREQRSLRSATCVLLCV